MPTRVSKPIVAYLHPYLEGRRKEIRNGLYPKHHLWGIEAVAKVNSWEIDEITTQDFAFPRMLERLVNRTFFPGSPGVRAEFAAWRKAHSCNLIYSVCGPLTLARHFKKARLVSWVFRKPDCSPKSRFSPYARKNLDSHGGFLCLTPGAERGFAEYGKSKFLPWYVDLQLFDGLPCKQKPQHPFFLATGKTSRDYNTLIEAAKATDVQIRIIGPENQCPDVLPPNVQWTNTSDDPPDKAIDYPTLREWYAQCTGVCIPLTGDPEDTCGYTNLLEAMAMSKPVIMTRSGCLQLNPEEKKFGFIVNPSDAIGWASKINLLARSNELAQKMGTTGRIIAEKEYNSERFGNNVVKFIGEVLKNEPHK